jgi:hypothetical protein
MSDIGRCQSDIAHLCEALHGNHDIEAGVELDDERRL